MKEKNNKGFLLIEALISIVVFTLMLVSLFSSISLLQVRAQKSKYDGDATFLSQEGIEIAHATILSYWNEYEDGSYYPIFDADNNDWILESGEESNIKARFNRSIKLISVCRDEENGKQISDYEESGFCPGVIDNNSRYIETTVWWTENERQKKVSARLLVFNKASL